jgi:hypothetical protein
LKEKNMQLKKLIVPAYAGAFALAMGLSAPAFAQGGAGPHAKEPPGAQQEQRPGNGATGAAPMTSPGTTGAAPRSPAESPTSEAGSGGAPGGEGPAATQPTTPGDPRATPDTPVRR